jgi:hypothetical protein
VAYWVEVRATSRKVAGSIPDGVIDIFYCLNPSDRTMALGSTKPLTKMALESTEPLTKMSTRDVSWLVEEVGS